MNYQHNNYRETSWQQKTRAICRVAFPIIIIAAVIACFSGCNSINSKNGSDSALTEIADHLYETRYTEDFDWDKVENPDFSVLACSGVQNGQYRGRNYDLVYSNRELCVVHATATEKRPHSSVGIADLGFLDGSGKSYDLEQLPFLTVDGINDAGVCIQANTMPYGENGDINHTKSTDDDILPVAVVRYILDNAASVEEAISLLKTKDIHSEMDEYAEMHWMISGPTSNTVDTIKTVVVEAFPDGIHVTEDFIGEKPIMTNFNVSNFDGSVESIGFGAGYERWQILNENYAQANSVEGTFDLMEKVYATKLYDLNIDRFWYSDYNEVDLAACYEKDELKAMIGEEVYNDYMKKYGGVYYNPKLYDGEKALNGDPEKAGVLKAVVQMAAEYYNEKNTADESTWISIHTAVYDLKKKTLDIRLFETEDEYHFAIKKSK